jgi:hypothetical protein
MHSVLENGGRFVEQISKQNSRKWQMTHYGRVEREFIYRLLNDGEVDSRIATTLGKECQRKISIRKDYVDMIAYITERQEFFLVQELVTKSLIDRDLAFWQNYSSLRYFYHATPNHPKDMYRFNPDGKHLSLNA